MANPEQPSDTEKVEEQAARPQPEQIDDKGRVAEKDEEFVPRGAMRFALALIAGYIIYYFLIWHEVVILRGGA